MKVVHIESGLGNQMLSYCEYLALKKVNPNDEIYIETIIYDIPECNDVICQWNGYELEKIFGIHVPNFRQQFTQEEWNNIIHDIRSSRFWERNWNYPVCFVKAFTNAGLKIENFRGDFESPDALLMTKESTTLRARLKKTYLGYRIKRLLDDAKRQERIASVDERQILYTTAENNIFTGQRLAFKYVGNDIERIHDEIMKTFIFPSIEDSRNEAALKEIKATNSVAIHARRGDMLGYNYACYQFGYFKRAVKYIRQQVETPVFFFFCDSGSVEWCKKNIHIFGLNYEKDKVHFVDWNKGTNSYRDMQLMAQCKHQIITNSSFGWWGAYLNKNPNKITCSPDYTINTTHHF